MSAPTQKKPPTLPHQSTEFINLIRENPTESNAIEIPRLSLPKGGGALRGIDEKFEVNAANGTASFSIPLPLSPGRNDFTPALSLAYNSGAANSPFGLGWGLSLPSIQRKSDKQLPQYEDKEDVFLYAGAEDLVPFLVKDGKGNWSPPKAPPTGEIIVKRYRPRIEGDFSRIERITHPQWGMYWKVTTRDNITTILGRSEGSRIADPENSARIFRWLPEFSFDDKGDWIKYEYKEENLEQVPNALHEKNRKNGRAKFTNKYLKSVKYGNRIPYFLDPDKAYDPQPPKSEDCFFEVVFDYGEHDLKKPVPDDQAGPEWNCRPDPFSGYRAGFEIRTYRRCRRVLMFHHFEELGTESCLVRSLDFAYAPSSINFSAQAEVSYLKSITQSGYIRKPDGAYTDKSLPPMVFHYQQVEWDTSLKTVGKDSIVHAPVGLTNNYQWVDLYGEGVSGILTEQGTGWFYKDNLGDVERDGQVRFAPAKKVIPKPSFTGISEGVLQLQDLAANGQKQVVVNSPGLQGYFELTEETDWLNFQHFDQIANIDLSDPNTRLIDLNGDGQADLVVTDENVFLWYPADGKRGYKAAEKAAKPFDEESGPAIVFADQSQSIFLADMSGDGLTDIVRIRNGEICYWPNKGYGRFGAKVGMSNTPLFDVPDQFNPEYLHLADISGTGATDMLYLGKNQFKAFLNLSGNAWSEAHEIEPFFPVDKNSRLAVVDLLGQGTSCIVWSSDLPKHRQSPMRYIDLMGGRKPHVLIKYENNFGKETTIEYQSSTHFYLEDKRAGRPWITKLPFPVQVVSKLTVEDKITGAKFTNQYSYHHGYYDHTEREFRGFGRVDQLDAEEYENWKKSGASNVTEEQLHQKPVLTKTWFHTGAFLDRHKILSQFEEEYWYNHPVFSKKPEEYQLPEARLVDAQTNEEIQPEEISPEEWRQALRACKGMTLRQEVFTLGKLESEPPAPYSAAANNCHIQLLQPRAGNPQAVFMVTQSETITYHYEQNTKDPRIAHTLNVKIDELGNVLEAASVVYPRKSQAVDKEYQKWKDQPVFFGSKQEQQAYINSLQFIKEQQRRTWITYTQNAFTKNDIVKPEAYRLNLPAETKTYEITALPKAGAFYQMDDFREVLEGKTKEIDYAQNASLTKPQRRLIEHLRTLYYLEDLSGPLPFREFASQGLTYESYQLANTPDLIQHIFGQDRINDQLMEEGRYVQLPGHNGWWIRSGVVHYLQPDSGEAASDARDRFYSPQAYTDPFGSETKIRYYKIYYLAVEETKDAVGNMVKVEQFNWRTLTPQRMRDINDNLSEVLVDELGLVKAMALMGKGGEADELTGLDEWTSEAEKNAVQNYFREADSVSLETLARSLLQRASSRFAYDFDAYVKRGKPVVVSSISRETHYHLENNAPSRLQLSFEYSDGLGQVAMTKAQAEPGIAKRLHFQNGSYTVEEVDTSKMEPRRLRWIGNGRTVLNNKGNPVKQYEPYFSVFSHYEAAKELVETGVTPILYYDALDRLIRTQFPDETFSKVVFDAWKQESWDQNDTLSDSKWYQKRINASPELAAAGKDLSKERQAAEKTEAHHKTPSAVFLDTLGRPILQIEHNGENEQKQSQLYATQIHLDVEGNVQAVVDARNNPVMRYGYDMLGHRTFQDSSDGGRRWMFNNVAGNPARAWDSRKHVFIYQYDLLQRPAQSWVKGGENNQLDHLFEKIIYGENQTDDKARNLRGQGYIQYDPAGKVALVEYDFKGNLTGKRRWLLKDFQTKVNWSLDKPDDFLRNIDDPFVSKTSYDALNRVTQNQTPDKSVMTPYYNAAGLLEKVEVTQQGKTIPYVKHIDYDAKGQRTRIQYGNNVLTRYEYEPETFRLIHLETRKADNAMVQNLYYTYDPVGNITHLEDKSLPAVFCDNQKIEALNEYTYDPLYRLIEAHGREHKAQVRFGDQDNWNDQTFQKKHGIGDKLAWRKYRQLYTYDSVGNILLMDHKAFNGPTGQSGWKRHYTYATDNNRLMTTQIGDQALYRYEYHPDHGFLTRMPHLTEMTWNFRDELQSVTKGNGDPQKTCYIYDAEGQRMGKVTGKANAEGAIISKKSERLYVDGIEIYREYKNGEVELEQQTLHVMDDQKRIALTETITVKDGFPLPISAFRPRYQLGNHLGSAAWELDGQANKISYEEYHPYGTTAYQATNSAMEVSAKRYRYTGKERDEESGLYYYGARYYVPWLGRWGSVDPIGVEDGINIYSFVQANPINLIEVNGMKSGLWADTISGIRTAQRWVKQQASNYGQQDTIPAVLLIKTLRAKGINSPRLEKLILYPAVVSGAAKATGVELVAGMLMIGPNMLEALDTAGHEIGKGLGKTVAAKTWEGKALGIAEVSKGVARTALVVVQTLTMTRGGIASRRVRGETKVSAKAHSPRRQGNVPARPTQGDNFLNQSKAGDSLPGPRGVPISRRPTVAELEGLTKTHKVEFSVTYELGSGPKGGGGQYYLHSGNLGSVEVPISPTRIWIYHTHPKGAAFPSPADRKVLTALKKAGSPQRSSEIIPVGKGGVKVRFKEK